jgi:oxygen-independent coproporphyrinogen-3 oxidase
VGISRINADLLYGLPKQTVDSARASAEAAAALKPSRLAVFGYAHVPHMMGHQKLIKDDDLPGPAARIDQAAAMDAALTGAGYASIGIDHYARPDDPMAVALNAGTLRRNFQGYTTDRAITMIPVGASAIGESPAGYVQNIADVRTWRQAVVDGVLPVARGVAVSAEDALRRAIIERIMTDLRVDVAEVARRQGQPVPSFDLSELEAAGLARVSGSVVTVNRDFKPLARLVAAEFDGYLAHGPVKHSVSV